MEREKERKKTEKEAERMNGTNQKTNTEIVIERRRKKSIANHKVRSHFGAHEICVLQCLNRKKKSTN